MSVRALPIQIRALPVQMRQRGIDLLPATAFLAVVVAAALTFGVWAQEPTRVRLVVSGSACLAVVAIIARSPRHLLYTTLVWLTTLGLLRRVLGEFLPPSNADPLLLVSPLAFGLLALLAWRDGAFMRPTRLAKAVLALEALIVLGAVNPLQGSVTGGVAGLLFVFVPTLGFWIGRVFVDDRTLAVVLRLLAVLGVLVAIYGLSQTFVGFTSWDRHWIDSGAVGSLNVGGVIRPFGTLTSAAEYGTFISVGLVVWLAYWFRLLAAPIAIPVIGLLGTAVFLESSRGLVVITVATVGVILGARSRLPGLLTVAIAALLLGALGYMVKRVAVNHSGTTTSALVNHQVAGLANPLDPNASTASVHYSLMIDGMRASLHNPIGEGIGAITIAGSRFGGLSAGTELDPSNVSVALGIPGLIGYFVILVVGYRRLYERARGTGSGLAAAALGVATVTSLQWLNGGQYAVAILPWLMLGWVDRVRDQEEASGSIHS
jgi:hypothetical protein